LGEVKSPSVYTIPNEKITILEAIALAGDLTTFGKRDNILVVRDANGKRTFNRVDISRRDVFNSPYYYLHPNDVVYVEPVQGKFTSSDRSIQLLPIIISGLTLITTLLIAKFK
jgi:polysaccharide export outer membrane protein